MGYDAYDYRPMAPPEAPGRPIDASGLRLILVGALLVIFDFWVFGFDVIPDFAGHILVFAGLRRLAEFHPLFRRGQAFVLVNFLLSLSDIYSAAQAGRQVSEGWGIFAMIAAPVGLVFSLLALYHIIFGIAALAEKTNKPALALSSRRMFAAKAAMGAVSTLFGFAARFFPGAAAGGIVVIVLSIAIEIIYIVYLSRARRALDGEILSE